MKSWPPKQRSKDAQLQQAACARLKALCNPTHVVQQALPCQEPCILTCVLAMPLQVLQEVINNRHWDDVPAGTNTNKAGCSTCTAGACCVHPASFQQTSGTHVHAANNHALVHGHLAQHKRMQKLKAACARISNAPNVLPRRQALEGDADHVISQQHRAATVAAVDGSVNLDGQQGCASVAVVAAVNSADDALGHANIVTPGESSQHNDAAGSTCM